MEKRIKPRTELRLSSFFSGLRPIEIKRAGLRKLLGDHNHKCQNNTFLFKIGDVD